MRILYNLILGLIFISPTLTSAASCMFSPPYDNNFDVEREYYLQSALGITGSPSGHTNWCQTLGEFASFNTFNNTNWNPHTCNPVDFGLMTLTVNIQVQVPQAEIHGKGWSFCPLSNNN